MAQKISRPPARARAATNQKAATGSSKTGGVSGEAGARKRTRPRDEEIIENVLLGVLLFLLAVLVFLPAFRAGFIWDDDQLLTASPQVQSPDGWWTLWVKPITADYFPLTLTTLWIEFHLGQMGAFFSDLWNIPYLQQHSEQDVLNGYHIMNVLFHGTTAVLTWQTLKRLRVPGAWIAAALFAVHPICVESVAWISERKNTISQIFFLLSIIEYIRFQEKGKVWQFIAAVACFLLSLLAKTAVVMLPFILWVLAWWRYRDLVPLRQSYELEKNPTERGILLWSCTIAGAMAGGSLLLLKLILTFIAGGDAASAPLMPLLGGMGALIGGGAGYAVGLQLQRIRKWDSFAGFEVIRTLPFFLSAGLLGVVTIYFQYVRAVGGEEIPMGNLLQRLASASFAVGFYLYSALWPFNIIEIYPQWHRAFSLKVFEPSVHMQPPAPEAIPYWIQIIPGLLIAGLLYFCWTRRRESWARAMLAGLGCYILALIPALGLLKMSYMRLTLVADHFQYISIVAIIALVVAGGLTHAFRPVWLGVAAAGLAIITYLNWGQTADNHIEEIVWLIGVLTLALPAPDDLWQWIWRGFAAAVFLCFCAVTVNQAGIYHSEGTLWSATLEKNPTTWQGHNHLGAWLYMRGDVKGAFPHFLKATILKPENPESHNNLGLALSYFGMKDEAIKQYETAVKIKDDSAMETNLANAYEERKRYDDAIRTYQKALNLNENNASAWCNMGYALMSQGKLDASIDCFIKTVELDPGMPQGRGDLLQALRMEGIDPDAPVLSGSYKFDVRRAIELVRKYPPPPPQQQMPQQ